MKTKLRKAFALLLVLSMLTSLLSVGAYAAPSDDPATNPGTEQGGEPGGAPGGAPDGAPGGEPGGEPGGAPGGDAGAPPPPGGGSSEPVDLTGMLALKQYVFVASEGEIKEDKGTTFVSTDIYGIYEKGETVAFEPAAFDGEIAVYTNSELTEKADVTAAVSGSTLTLSGVATKGNIAYYLTTGEDAYTTTIYVVNDEYGGDSATLTLADGTTIDLSTYAPNMGSGDYTAVVGENEINGETSIYIGANRTAVSLSDLTDKENYAGYEDAVAWYLQSGITNAGDSLTTFGDKLYGYEYAVGLYRLFQIVVDQITAAKGYQDPADFNGAMFSNDPYSDAVSATLQAGVWNGIYTKLTDTKSEGDSGFWLTTNISEDVTTLGTGAVVDAEFAYVGLYNAFQSAWSSLNADGEAMAQSLENAAAMSTAASFKDANTSASWSWAAPFIGKSAAAGLFAGDETGFNAEKSLSRAELAQVLYAMAGKPAIETTTNSFTDLTQDWYKAAVEWCYANGVVAGRTTTSFEPDSPVTRQEMALMLMKFCQVEKIDLTGSDDLAAFGDKADVAEWAADAVKWAVGNGLIAGSDGKLLPDASTTRAMAATIMSHLADFAPYDYSNAAKIAAVSTALLGENAVPAAGKTLTKAEAVNILYTCRGYVASKTAPDATLAEKTGSAWADMSQFFTAEYGANPIVVESGEKASLTEKDNLISTEGSALMVLAGGSANVTNSTISLVGNADTAAGKITTLEDPNRTLDGAEAVLDPGHVGFVYNATTRNAFYRVGLGSALTIWGGNVVLTSTDGTLAIDGEANSSSAAGTMAGTAYASYGGSLLVKNAVAFSAGQHLTNNLYNGTIHYLDAAAISSGRVYSSDFWGGYQVFEDTIASGDNVTDESTTLIVKNSVYGNSVGGNGFAAQYFENSILNVSTATFQNTTSLVTDAGALTVVNSVLNNSSSTLAASNKGERAIITLVDSIVNLNGNCLATVANRDSVNCISTQTVTTDIEEYKSLYDGEMAIYFYGDVNLNIPELAKLTVDVAEGAKLTVYSANLTKDDIVNTGAGELVVVTDAAYGTVVVGPVPQASNVGQYAGVAISNDSRDTSREYIDGVTVKGTITDNFFSGSIDTDSYYATGILVNDSTYRIFKSNINMGTTAADNASIPVGGAPEIGAGSGIAIRNGSTVTISDSTINTSGAWASMDYPRSGVVVGWQAANNGDVVIMRNTTITNNGDDENTSNVGYFPAIPGFPLNIMRNLTVSGQGRAYVALGDAVSYLYNDDIEGTGWAAICTDMATTKGLYVYALGTTGLTTVGGYGVYSDTNCYDYFYASTLQGADFGAILSNNGLLVMDSALNASEEALAYATKTDIATAATKDSAIIGGRNAIMTHATDAQTEDTLGVIDLANTKIVTDLAAKGTTEEQSYLDGFEKFFELCDGADILIKSSSEDVDLVNVEATSYTDTLILAVVDSDNGGAKGDLPANEIYLNNVTSTGEAMNIYNYDFQRGMNVEIENMDLVGAINYLTYDEYLEDPYLDGIIDLQSTDDSNAGINLTIGKNATWTPTGISRVSSLTVKGDIDGVVLVDGKRVEVKAGETYTGNVVVAPETVKIADVSFTDNYVESHATDNDVINSASASSNIASVTLSEGTVIRAKDGGVLTLVVNGDQYDILDYLEKGTDLKVGEFSFETTAGSAVDGNNPMFATGKFMNMAGQPYQYTYRAALTVGADGIVENESIPALLTKAIVTDSSISNGQLNSFGAFFNSIIVDSAPFVISNMELNGIGDGANDFNGSGAVVFAKGSADVTVDNSVITTAGVIRTATSVTDNAIMRINDSVVYTQETEDTQAEYDALVVPMMKRTPFALGLEGVVRATNVLGAGQGIYTDSLIVSTGWGVLSTDSGSSYEQVGTYALDVSNTIAGNGTIEIAQEGKEYTATKTIDGVTYGYTAGGSGYVAYADGGVYDKFDNVTFYGGNEVQIMASNQSSAFYTNSELNSGHIGVMTQQNNGGLISVVDSTMNVGETAIQIKSGGNIGYTNVLLDGTEINFTNEAANWGETLVELVQSDDAGDPGVTKYVINDVGDEATNADVVKVVDDSNATLTNGTYDGNIWNNVYTNYQALNVTIDDATVNGTISSSYSYHVNDDGSRMANGTELFADTTGNYLKSGVTDYAKIGAQYNVANRQVNNPLNVELVNNATWNVVLADTTNGEAEACYINNLTVEAGSVITADKPVTIYVHGTLDVAEGSIGENVKIVEDPIEAPAFSSSSFTMSDYNSPANTITFNVVDEKGNPVSGAVSEKHQSFAYILFTLTAMSGYEIKDVQYSENVIVDDGTNGIDYNGYENVITLTGDATATVVVEAQQQGPGAPPPGGDMPPMP